MEKALRYELETKIPELSGEVYPTNAPETASKPYLVYARINTDKTKTLKGYTEKQALSYMFSVIAVKYADMINTRDKVEELLLSLPKTSIGNDSSIYVTDLNINNITEAWEPELKVNRGIIDFTIYF